MPAKPHVLATHELYLADENATILLAQELAQHLAPINSAAHLYLTGDLGAGKTAFTRAFLQALGVKGRIKSPSYALLESYEVKGLKMYHLDFYRFNSPEEWVEAGFRDILEEQAVVIIEWPEKAAGLLAPPDLHLYFHYQDEGRQLLIQAHSTKGKTWLETLKINN